MAVETSSLFAQVIQDHLELKRKNSALEGKMPISGYMAEDPFENHPLFKTEEQARVEDTMSGQESILQEPTTLDWPAAEDTFIVEPEPVEAEAAESADAPVDTPVDPGPADGELLDAGPAEPGSEHPAEPSENGVETPLPEADAESEEGLWTRSRDFDWGD